MFVSQMKNSKRNKNMQTEKPRAVLLASLGMGHLIPMVELGKRLVTHHDFILTIFIVTTDDEIKPELINSQNPNLSYTVLRPSSCTPKRDSSSSGSLSTSIHAVMDESLPLLRAEISKMEPRRRPEMLVVDLFGTHAFSVADEFKMLKCYFHTSNAWFLSFMISNLVLGSETVDDHVNRGMTLKIPGCKPVRSEDSCIDPSVLTDLVRPKFLATVKRMTQADVILINTWENLEPTTLKAFKDDTLLGTVLQAPVYPVGPVTRSVGSECVDNPVLSWLNKQPKRSVIYVSFGSGGTLSTEQMTELAYGLELSQQRFIWVIRPPVEDNTSGSFFTVGNNQDENDTFTYLPRGFSDRISGVGLLVHSWAPQQAILQHPSVGGFLTHCGWNSALEGLVNGLPMITWPLYAEQKMNAAMLTEEVGVAVRSKEGSSNGEVIRRDEIMKMVKKIMVDEDGERMRKRGMELKHDAEKALSEVGRSYHALSEVRKKCGIRLN